MRRAELHLPVASGHVQAQQAESEVHLLPHARRLRLGNRKGLPRRSSVACSIVGKFCRHFISGAVFSGQHMLLAPAALPHLVELTFRALYIKAMHMGMHAGVL